MDTSKPYPLRVLPGRGEPLAQLLPLGVELPDLGCLRPQLLLELEDEGVQPVVVGPQGVPLRDALRVLAQRRAFRCCGAVSLAGSLGNSGIVVVVVVVRVVVIHRVSLVEGEEGWKGRGFFALLLPCQWNNGDEGGKVGRQVWEEEIPGEGMLREVEANPYHRMKQ